MSMAWWCNGYGIGLAIERSRVRYPAVPPPGNDSGQVVHTRVHLSPSSVIWYRPKRLEGNGSRYVGEVWPTAHITELCLQLTVGSGPCKRRWAPTLRSQSCERAMLTVAMWVPLPFYLSISHWGCYCQVVLVWCCSEMADAKPMKVGAKVEVVGKGVIGTVAYIGTTLFSSGNTRSQLFIAKSAVWLII